MIAAGRSDVIDVEISPRGLPGRLRRPSNPRGVIVFAHGSGSNRQSPRNVYVAEALCRQDFAPLLFDFLSEREALNRANVFNIQLLTKRLVAACKLALAPDATHLFSEPGALDAVIAAAADWFDIYSRQRQIKR